MRTIPVPSADDIDIRRLWYCERGQPMVLLPSSILPHWRKVVGT